MITVMVRLRLDDWDRFKSVHDQPDHLAMRRQAGNLSHHVLTQLDDPTDVVFFDTWDDPQGSDSYYHTDHFQQDLESMGGGVVEIIKLEHSDAADIGEALFSVE